MTAPPWTPVRVEANKVVKRVPGTGEARGIEGPPLLLPVRVRPPATRRRASLYIGGVWIR